MSIVFQTPTRDMDMWLSEMAMFMMSNIFIGISKTMDIATKQPYRIKAGSRVVYF